MSEHGKTVVITGASSGIGLDAAKRYVELGANVVINSRTESKLKKAADLLGNPDRVAVVPGDIGDINTGKRIVETAVERFGKIDVLVNNAGIFELKPFVDVTEDDLDRSISTNLRGTYFVTQAVVKQLIKQGKGGSIVNIGTVLIQHPMVGLPATAPLTGKGAIHALTTGLAAELAEFRIRVNTVAPGVIRTPLYGDADVDSFGGIALLNRVGEVREITEAVIHLANAEFTTGVILPVDGGYVGGRASAQKPNEEC